MTIQRLFIESYRFRFQLSREREAAAAEKKYRTADGNGGHTAQCTRDKNKQKHMKLYLRAPQMESRWIHFEEREKKHTRKTRQNNMKSLFS